MAQKIMINGVTYSGVSSIKIPLADTPETLAVFPDTSDATATEGNILNGQTAYVGGSLVTGDMPNNGAYRQTITAVAQVVTIPEGYHDGNGTVQLSAEGQEALVPGNIKNGVTILGVSGEANVNDTTLPDAGATAGDILTGKKGWVNGELVTGTMASNGTLMQTITAPSQVVTLKTGYYAGGTVKINEADQKLLVAGNIKSGVTILGVDGGPNVNDTTLTSTAAGAGDIALGKQAWANGVLLTGTGSQPTISLSDGVLSIS